MSGHSKWAQIKHKKAATDIKKGKLFSKLANAISIAAREGGGDPNFNVRLRMAIEKAKEANMSKEAIEKAIKRGTGELEGTKMEPALYEGYGPGGIAILVEVLTGNKNRTASEIRNIFTRHNGRMGESGCVAWMFEQKGVIIIENPKDAEKLTLTAIDAGALDIKEDNHSFEIYTEPKDLETIKQSIENLGEKIASAEISKIAKTEIRIDNPEEAKKILALMDALEEHEEVTNVYANFNIDEELLTKT